MSHPAVAGLTRRAPCPSATLAAPGDPDYLLRSFHATSADRRTGGLPTSTSAVPPITAVVVSCDGGARNLFTLPVLGPGLLAGAIGCRRGLAAAASGPA